MAEPIWQETFQVAYFKHHKDDHSMAVDDLASVLLAYEQLVKAASRELNGDRASVRLIVKSDSKTNASTSTSNSFRFFSNISTTC